MSTPRVQHFYHHMWCGICGRYTVHDAHICIHCKNEPTYKSAPTLPEPTPESPQGEGSD